MELSQAPVQITLPFANQDLSRTNPIPVPSQISITPGAASFTDGFPPLCATPVSSGGIPPSKADMDGILFMISALSRWYSADAGYQFSSTFATDVGGYPIGARVLNAAGNGYWLNLTDNNITNPDTGSIPTGWQPLTGTVASVYASTQLTQGSGSNPVVFDTVEFDQYGLWNHGSLDFEALWPGKYRLSGFLYLPSPANQLIGAAIFKNNALAKQCFETVVPGGTAQTFPFDGVINCTHGDHLEVYMNLAASSALIGQPTGSNAPYVFAQLEFLGA